MTGQLSDEILGKCTLEESAVANVVIEGDTPDIDDLKKEIKIIFSNEIKTMDSLRIIILLSLITNEEMNCLTRQRSVQYSTVL